MSDLAGLGVNARKIGAFMQIAMVTGQRQILRRVFSSMLASNHVLYMKDQRLSVLSQSAIFAKMIGTIADKLAERRVHQPAPVCSRMRRALA